MRIEAKETVGTTAERDEAPPVQGAGESARWRVGSQEGARRRHDISREQQQDDDEGLGAGAAEGERLEVPVRGRWWWFWDLRV